MSNFIAEGFWQAVGAGLFVAVTAVAVYLYTRKPPAANTTSSTTSGCGCGG